MTEKSLIVQQQEAMAEAAEAQAEEKLAQLLANDPHLLDMTGAKYLKKGDTGQPPFLKLAQGKDSELGVEPGQFYNTMTGEVYGEALEIIPLMALVATRANYFKPYEKGKPPLCASDDGVMPRESTDRRPLLDPQPGPCATCPRAAWPTDEEKVAGKARPDCTRQRNFMVVTREAPLEFMRLMMMITANRCAKNLTSLMVASGIRKSIVLANKYVESDKGNYYVPLVMGGGRLRADELLTIIEVCAGIERLVESGEIRIAAEEENGEYADADTAAPVGLQPEEEPLAF